MQASLQAQMQQEKLLQQVELRRRMRGLVVPTNDQQVKQMLRSISKPITLFGEREVSVGAWVVVLPIPSAEAEHWSDPAA